MIRQGKRRGMWPVCSLVVAGWAILMASAPVEAESGQRSRMVTLAISAGKGLALIHREPKSNIHPAVLDAFGHPPSNVLFCRRILRTRFADIGYDCERPAHGPTLKTAQTPRAQ